MANNSDELSFIGFKLKCNLVEGHGNNYLLKKTPLLMQLKIILEKTFLPKNTNTCRKSK